MSWESNKMWHCARTDVGKLAWVMSTWVRIPLSHSKSYQKATKTFAFIHEELEVEGNCLCLWWTGYALSYDVCSPAVHIFSWLPVNFSLPFKGTPQHLKEVIAHIQMLILMDSSPFGLLWCGVSKVKTLCNIWLCKVCYISQSVFFYLVPEKSPFTLWGIFLKLHAYSWVSHF